MSAPTAAALESGLQQTFSDAGVRGFIAVIDVDSGATVGLDAGELVVLASVFKVPVLVELYRRADAGDIDLTGRVRVPASERTLGPTGISVMKDDVELSWRDLAQIMICVSDNTATDVIARHLGVERINATMSELGLERTRLIGTCEDLLSVFREDLDMTDEQVKDPAYKPDPERLRRNRSLLPESTTSSTPAEIARLLRMIWLDQCASAESCADMRRILYTQVWPHRLSSAFGDGIRIGAKTGTLAGIRNEAGVVEYPDGGRFAAAVFTRAFDYTWHQPAADAVIGTAARQAIEHLRAG